MRFLLVALLLVTVSVSAENLNDLPLYGGFPKTPAMIQADQDFVEKAVQAAGSRGAALDNEIMRGWQHLRSGKTTQAIRRFNQAYLLEPNSADVYWGLGAVLSQTGQYDDSLRMFNRAYTLAPKNVRLVADIGLARTRYALGYSTSQAVQTKRLESALLWFDVAERVDPTYPMIYANRAITLTFLERYPEAWQNVEKAEALDQFSVDRSLIERLSKVHPRPQRAAATQAASARKAPYVPEKRLKPRVRVEARTAPVAPKPPVAPQASSTPAGEVAPVGRSGAEVMPGPTAIRFVPVTTVQSGTQDKSKRRLHVIGGKPVNARGPDKRDCLSLPTNEQIMRCVYPVGKR